MTYIQDKLDAFDKQFGKAGDNRNCDSIGRWAGCDDCESNIELRDEHRKYVEQSLTDYHNHIVEKIKQRFESGEYEIEDGFSYQNGIELSEVPNELFIEFKGIRKGISGITKYIKKDLIKLLDNI